MTPSKSVKPYTLHPTPCPQEKLFAANPNYPLLVSPNSGIDQCPLQA
ncbi:MAG: hypothetical protein O9295_11830 [Microcystis sp. LE18-22.4A]|nr:hypothetical protein [Microcystis sp. LE18-22.4A]